jgi:alcohol dehydrogenase class IV
VIVRWSLGQLSEVLTELEIARPLVVATRRWNQLVDPPYAGRWAELPTGREDVPAGADGVLAIGGGSAIDTAKHASSLSGLPLVSVPTTYSGAEWTPSFGIRDPGRRIVGGGGGALLAGIVYDVELTLDLPRAETVGTALNALAHCAEALYGERSERSDELALEGAALIAEWLPKVVDAPQDRDARTGLLEGACAAGEALALAGLALAHAMAQALGGTFGLPHGAANALTLAPALRFNEQIVPVPVRQFRHAITPRTVEELARLGGFERLRDLGVPEDGLPAVAELAAGRMGNTRNPRRATPAEIEELLRSIY